MTSQKLLAILVVTHPTKPDQRVEISSTPFHIGRGIEENDFSFSEEELRISRRHARLSFDLPHVFLTDLGSSNGTFINAQQLDPHKPYSISYEDEIRIGNYTLWLTEAELPETSDSEPTLDSIESEYEPQGTLRPTIIVSTEDPPPSPSPRPEDLPLPVYYRLFGISSPCRYLQYLPPIYCDDNRHQEFLDLFLQALESFLAPLEQKVDNFDLYLDPKTAPAFFLSQLAAWVDIAMDERWSEAKQRHLLIQTGFIHLWRGTKKGLSSHLTLFYPNLSSEIIEPEDQPHYFEVKLRIPPDYPSIEEVMIRRIIEAHKPAHTTYKLRLEMA